LESRKKKYAKASSTAFSSSGRAWMARARTPATGPPAWGASVALVLSSTLRSSPDPSRGPITHGSAPSFNPHVRAPARTRPAPLGYSPRLGQRAPPKRRPRGGHHEVRQPFPARGGRRRDRFDVPHARARGRRLQGRE